MKIEKPNDLYDRAVDAMWLYSLNPNNSPLLDRIKSDLFFKEHENLDLRNEPNAYKYAPIRRNALEDLYSRPPFIDHETARDHIQVNRNLMDYTVHYRLKCAGVSVGTVCSSDDYDRFMSSGSDVEQTIVDDLKDRYNNYILKERFGMTNVEFNQIEASIRSRGGYMEFETAPGCETMANIHLPLEMLKDVRFNDPTEKYIVKDLINGNKLDIPAITNIKFYNDRATIMKFADGTETRVETQNGEPFNADTGMAYCMFKKLLGKDGHRKFNDLMRAAHKQLENQEKDKKIAEENKQKEKRWREKAKAEKNRRKAKKRNEEISLQREAIVQALQYMNSLNNPNNGGGHNA